MPAATAESSVAAGSDQPQCIAMDCWGKYSTQLFFHVEPKAKMLSEKTSSANVNPMSFVHVVFRVGVIVHVVFRVGVKL